MRFGPSSEVMLLSEGSLAVSEWPLYPPGVMVTFRTRMSLRTMSGTMVLPQPGSVVISMSRVATKAHKNLWPLSGNL